MESTTSGGDGSAKRVWVGVQNRGGSKGDIGWRGRSACDECSGQGRLDFRERGGLGDLEDSLEADNIVDQHESLHS